MDLLSNQTPEEAFWGLLQEPAILLVLGIILIIVILLYILLFRN